MNVPSHDFVIDDKISDSAVNEINMLKGSASGIEWNMREQVLVDCCV